MRVLRVWASCAHLNVVAIIALGPTASAQTIETRAWTYGIAVGSPVVGLPIPGAGIALGRATWQPTRRFALRSEATVAHLPSIHADYSSSSPCPTESPCSSRTDTPKSLVGVSGHVIVNDDYITRGESRGAYYILGGGMYRAFSPSAVGSIGGAMEGGLGFKFGAGSVEVKGVYIRHWTGGDSGMIPVTIGYTW